MKTNAVKRYLNSFGKRIVKQAKNNLKRKDKIASGKLFDSIKYKLIRSQRDGTYSVVFTMADYGKFVDHGVSGTGGSFKGGKYAGQSFSGRNYFKDHEGNRRQSPFRFGSGKSKGGSIYRGIDKWTIRRSLAPRDEKGRFVSRLSLKTAIVKVLWIKGIEGISFFSKPIFNELKTFKKGFMTAFTEDFKNNILHVVELKK